MITSAYLELKILDGINDGQFFSVYNKKFGNLLVNKNGLTPAIYLAISGHIPAKCFHHHPCFTFNEGGNTVAMYLANNGVVPPSEWQHDPCLQNKYDATVEDYLTEKNIEVPQRWKTPPYEMADINIDDEVCIICQESDCSRKCVTKCGHVVCEVCSGRYFKKHCPYCKCEDFRKKQQPSTHIVYNMSCGELGVLTINEISVKSREMFCQQFKEQFGVEYKRYKYVM